MYLIYYIYHKDCLLYIGSTKDFNGRKRHHKSYCYNKNDIQHYNLILYQYIRNNNIIWEDLIWKTEETNIINISEAHKLERVKIEELKPIYNVVIPTRSQEERYELNKEHILEKGKKWNEENKERVKENKKKWNEENKEKNREYKKKYREKNREEINKRERERRQNKKIENI